MFYICTIVLNYYTKILKVLNIAMLSKSKKEKSYSMVLPQPTSVLTTMVSEKEKSYPMVVAHMTRVLITMISELCIWRPCKVEYLDHLGKLSETSRGEFVVLSLTIIVGPRSR